MVDRILIVGAGQAAAQAIDTLRRKGFKGALTLIGAEPHLPYQRPPLSKKYLSGALEQERLLIRPAHFYTEHAVETRLGRRAELIDRERRSVRLDDGSAVGYDLLLLATGSKPRRMVTPGANLAGVHYLRNIADVEGIRPDLVPGKRMVVIGGGYIGLEVAATAREIGLEVTVLEMADRVMNRVTCAEVSAFYQAEHAKHGVRIVCNARVEALHGTGQGTVARVRAVACADGSEHPADIVIAGIGVFPEDQLARDAGLECENGIVVDQHCRTSDPNIFAAGDCTSHPSIHYGRHIRLESVDNAFEQASSAALNMLGVPTPHDKVPWFWSDQYDLTLQVAGLAEGATTHVDRPVSDDALLQFHLADDGRLLAASGIATGNAIARDVRVAEMLIAKGARPDPAALADPNIRMKSLLA